ncbi:MAG: helix-turn-helix transcriptional regulator, partial [Oscillospiraceae bacterium]
VSQRTAAADLGISQALLSHYENGIREPGLPFVVRACDYYHVSADFALGRTLSRDGAMIASEDVYDVDAESAVLKGSVLATLQNKLIGGAVSVLFDLLGKLGNKAAISGAAAVLGSGVYQLYRQLYRSAGGNESWFSADSNAFLMDGLAADRKLSELRYAAALAVSHEQKANFPDVSEEALHTAYPGRCQSMAQVLHTADARLAALTAPAEK